MKIFCKVLSASHVKNGQRQAPELEEPELLYTPFSNWRKSASMKEYAVSEGHVYACQAEITAAKVNRHPSAAASPRK